MASWPGSIIRSGKGMLSVGLQSDFGKDIERPRNNSNVVRFYYPYEDSHRFTSSYELLNVAGFQQIGVTGFVGTFEQRTDQDRFATATTGRSIERADVSANDFHVKGNAVRAVGPARVEFGVDVNGRYDLNALDDPAGLRPRRRDHQRRHQCLGRQRPPHRHGRVRPGGRAGGEAVQAVGRPARRSRDDREHRRLLRRSIDGQRRILRLRRGDGRAVHGTELHRAGRPRIPRSHALRPLLPWPVGPRLHHRQSGSRARDQPAVRPRHAVCDRDRPSWRPTSTTTGSTISSSAIRRRRTSSSSAIAAAPASAGSKPKSARRCPPASRLKSARTSGAARRSTTTPTSTTSRPTRSRCWSERTSPDGRSRRCAPRSSPTTIARVRARSWRPGRRSSISPADSGSTRIPRAPRQRPEPARRRLLRQPGSALGLCAGPIGQRDPGVSVLTTGAIPAARAGLRPVTGLTWYSKTLRLCSSSVSENTCEPSLRLTK